MSDYIGIDVSKKKLDCSWLKEISSGKLKSKVFKNTSEGYHELISWLQQHVAEDLSTITVTLEPTGVYHEALSYYLHEKGLKLLLVNPGKAKAFADSQNQQNKTDKKDSVMLARYGYHCRGSLVEWKPERPEIRQLKSMIRRLGMLEQDCQREENRLEAAECSDVSERVLDSIHDMTKVLKEEIEKLKRDIDDHIDGYPELKQDRNLLMSITGVGEVVSREMVYLLNSKSFSSGRQVSAFLGLTPRHCESGQWRGRTRISKKGPGRLRAKLYMAAVVCCQHNELIRILYRRLLSNGKTKMEALCAAMRKLVEICFAVLKHQSEYRSQSTQKSG